MQLRVCAGMECSLNFTEGLIATFCFRSNGVQGVLRQGIVIGGNRWIIDPLPTQSKTLP